MGEQILATAPLLETVEYELPNNHYFEIGTFDQFSCCKDLLLTPYRSQLAQGDQEHRQGRRGVRSPVQPQRPYQMHCWPCWPQGQAVNASLAGLWSSLHDLLSSFLLYIMSLYTSGSETPNFSLTTHFFYFHIICYISTDRCRE